MEKIKDEAHYHWAIENCSLLLLYFSGNMCSVCASLKPKIEMLVEQQFPSLTVFEIESEKFPEIAARYNVFSVPVIVFLVDKHEYVREARNISISELSQKIEKIINLYQD
jgi:thiol-disulfide isomerase/thioredoxin